MLSLASLMPQAQHVFGLTAQYLIGPQSASVDGLLLEPEATASESWRDQVVRLDRPALSPTLPQGVSLMAAFTDMQRAFLYVYEQSGHREYAITRYGRRFLVFAGDKTSVLAVGIPVLHTHRDRRALPSIKDLKWLASFYRVHPGLEHLIYSQGDGFDELSRVRVSRKTRSKVGDVASDILVFNVIYTRSERDKITGDYRSEMHEFEIVSNVWDPRVSMRVMKMEAGRVVAVRSFQEGAQHAVEQGLWNRLVFPDGGLDLFLPRTPLQSAAG